MSENIPQKKAFNFYRSYYDSLNMLNDKQYVEFSKALNSVMFFDAHIDNIQFKDKMLMILWASVKHSLRQSIDGFLSKNKIQYNQAISTPCQGGHQAPAQAPCQQGEGEGEEQGKGKEEVEQAGATSALDYSSWPNLPSDQVMKDWLAHRKKLKASVSQTAITRLGKKLHKAREQGYTVDDCLGECIERAWKGFDVEWMKSSNKPSANISGIQRNGFENTDYSGGL